MSEKKSDLVAVMLPRDVADRRSVSAHTLTDCAVLSKACKRALRPDPPDNYFLHLVRKLAGPNPTDRSESDQALKWIEHVLEHGWDPSE